MKKIITLFTLIFLTFYSFGEDFKPFKIGSDTKTVINTMLNDNWKFRVDGNVITYEKDDQYYDNFKISEVIMCFDDKNLLIENISFDNIMTLKTSTQYILAKIYDCKLIPIERLVEKKDDAPYDDVYEYTYKCYDSESNIYWYFKFIGADEVGYIFNITFEKIE